MAVQCKQMQFVVPRHGLIQGLRWYVGHGEEVCVILVDVLAAAAKLSEFDGDLGTKGVPRKGV